MLDRRNSARLPLTLKVRELNGEYMYTWDSADLSEEGLFLKNKVCFSNQDAFSKLTFSLPGGIELSNITARIVREAHRGSVSGSALEFMNLSEEHRMILKRFLVERAA
jgi:hypothetical protein